MMSLSLFRLVIIIIIHLLTYVLSNSSITIQNLLNEYISQHSSSIIENESSIQLCKRKFVYASFKADDSVGNQLGPFLNNFAIAVVTNRTLIVSDHSHRKTLLVNSWIIREYLIQKLFKNANCSSNDILNHIQNFPSNYKCCQIDAVNVTIFSVPGLSNAAYEELHPFSGALLNRISQNRSKVLFQNPYGYGRFDSFGFLFNAAATFSPEIKDMNKKILSGLNDENNNGDSNNSNSINNNMRKNTSNNGSNDSINNGNEIRDSSNINSSSRSSKGIVLGIHIRHRHLFKNENEDLEIDLPTEKCIGQIIFFLRQNHNNYDLNNSNNDNNNNHNNKLNNDQNDSISSSKNNNNNDNSNNAKCTLLLATDRSTTLLNFIKFALKINCHIEYASKNITQNNLSNIKEHGPWSDETSTISDWYLLSQSDYFIGSDSSTFSILIANLVAAKATSNKVQGSPLVWMDGSNCRFVHSRDEYHYEMKIHNSCVNSTVKYNSINNRCE